MKLHLLRHASTVLSPLVLLAVSAAPVAAADSAKPAVADSAKPAVAAPANPQTAAAQAWNFAASDVAVDPNIVFGILISYISNYYVAKAMMAPGWLSGAWHSVYW